MVCRLVVVRPMRSLLLWWCGRLSGLSSWRPTSRSCQQFCAIRSYLSAAAKHGKHFFEVLVMLTENRPWQPTTH
jgi:hypothetical protein